MYWLVMYPYLACFDCLLDGFMVSRDVVGLFEHMLCVCFHYFIALRWSLLIMFINYSIMSYKL